MIKKLQKEVIKDIMSCQLFTCFGDILYYITYKLQSLHATIIVITLDKQHSLKLQHNASTTFKTTLDPQTLTHLQNICQITQTEFKHEKVILIEKIFQKFPVRQGMLDKKKVFREVRALIESLSVVLHEVKFVLKGDMDLALVYENKSEGAEQEKIKFKLSQINNSDMRDVEVYDNQRLTLYWSKSKKGNLKRILCSVNGRECQCPKSIVRVIKDYVNKQPYLIYIIFKLESKEYEQFKRQLWIYKDDLIVDSMRTIFERCEKQKQQQRCNEIQEHSVQGGKQKQIEAQLQQQQEQKTSNRQTQKINYCRPILTQQQLNDDQATLVIRRKPTQRKFNKYEVIRSQLEQIQSLKSERDKQDLPSTINNLNLFSPPSLFQSQLSLLIPKCQFYKGFIVCQYKHKMFMIDQHAATQKIFYQSNLKPESKSVDLKLQIEIVYQDTLLLLKNQLFRQGWNYEVKRNQNHLDVRISSVPQYVCYVCDEHDLESIVLYGQDYLMDKIKKSVANYACSHAYKVGDILNDDQIQSLIRSLGKIKSPFNCPHGRPTIIEIEEPKRLIRKTYWDDQYFL